jgi:hypothetical protein
MRRQRVPDSAIGHHPFIAIEAGARSGAAGILIMTTSLSEGGLVLRFETSIADAVHSRGLFPVLAAAIHAWMVRPRLPHDLPARLRADIGLPVADDDYAWVLRLAHPTPPPSPRLDR